MRNKPLPWKNPIIWASLASSCWALTVFTSTSWTRSNLPEYYSRLPPNLVSSWTSQRKAAVATKLRTTTTTNFKRLPPTGHRCELRKRGVYLLLKSSNRVNEIDTDENKQNQTDANDEYFNSLFEHVAEALGNETPADISGKATESTDSLVVSADSKPVEEDFTDSSYFVQRQKAIGIGGNDGFVYDVNALKRNLVQESVRGCKRELLVLLGDEREDQTLRDNSTSDGRGHVLIVPPKWKRDRDDLIEERLSALVQANPVSTTTDSNLLDGKWAFAFATNSASSILDTSRFLLSKTKRKNFPPGDSIRESDEDNRASLIRGGPWRFRSGKTENPFRSSTRQIFLEDLKDDEDAHIIDTTRILGGLFQINRRYEVFGLTRTALDLDLTQSEMRLFGFRAKRKTMDELKGTKLGAPLEVQILYLDTDLCICTTGAGLLGPLHVYTKSDQWVTGRAKRKLRLLAKTASWLSTMQSPLRVRRKILNLFTRKGNLSIPIDPDLKTLNIGEFYINDDGTTREDPSWDGEDDPFYHLTPSERMEVLKTMSLQDIYRAALNRKMQSKKEKKRWANRSKKFKKPDQ